LLSNFFPQRSLPIPKKTLASKSTAKPDFKNATKSVTTKKPVAKPANNKAARAKSEPRIDTKKAIVLDLLLRNQGATTTEIAKATDWQNHSIRGFISGHVTKRMGLKVESTKNEAGERTYRIAK
jgi:predicted HTH transcriptional regulator